MKYFLPLVFIALLLPACYPNYGLTTTDYRTVITLYDTATYDNPAERAELSTYFLIDSVFHLLDEGQRDTITRKYDDELIDFVASNFNSMNWKRITDTAGGVVPSTLVRITVSTATTSGVYWNWWGGWYPWYGGGWWGYPGWGWGGYYPPYWGGGSYYEYSTGSVIVHQDRVHVPANPTDSLELSPIWIGTSNGLLATGTSANLEIIATEMRQMFSQSPYLVITSQP